MNWGGNVDQLVASWQKPFGTYASVLTLCYCAVFIPGTRDLVLPGLLALAGFNGGMRTIEKMTAMKTSSTASTTVSTDAGSKTEDKATGLSAAPPPATPRSG